MVSYVVVYRRINNRNKYQNTIIHKTLLLLDREIHLYSKMNSEAQLSLDPWTSPCSSRTKWRLLTTAEYSLIALKRFLLPSTFNLNHWNLLALEKLFPKKKISINIDFQILQNLVEFKGLQRSPWRKTRLQPFNYQKEKPVVRANSTRMLLQNLRQLWADRCISSKRRPRKFHQWVSCRKFHKPSRTPKSLGPFIELASHLIPSTLLFCQRINLNSGRLNSNKMKMVLRVL